jgi:hypothetical protein
VSLDPLMTTLKCSPMAERSSGDLSILLTDVRSVEAADDSENFVLTMQSGDRLFLSVYGERTDDEFECWLHGLTLMTGGGRMRGEGGGVRRSGSGRAAAAAAKANGQQQRPVYEPQYPPAGMMSSTSSAHSYEVSKSLQPSQAPTYLPTHRAAPPIACSIPFERDVQKQTYIRCSEHFPRASVTQAGNKQQWGSRGGRNAPIEEFSDQSSSECNDDFVQSFKNGRLSSEHSLPATNKSVAGSEVPTFITSQMGSTEV